MQAWYCAEHEDRNEGGKLVKTVRLLAILVAALFLVAMLMGGCGKSGAAGQKAGDVGAAKPAPETTKAEMANKMGSFVKKGGGQPGGGPPPEMKGGAGGAAAPVKTG